MADFKAKRRSEAEIRKAWESDSPVKSAALAMIMSVPRGTVSEWSRKGMPRVGWLIRKSSFDAWWNCHARKTARPKSKPRQARWMSFATAALTVLRRNGDCHSGDLQVCLDGKVKYIAPDAAVWIGLIDSKIPPSLLAFSAANFAKMQKHRRGITSTDARRESSSAAYWLAIPGFDKRLASYCRNRAPRRIEAWELIARLADVPEPRHDRNIEVTEVRKGTVIRSEILEMISPEFRVMAEAKIQRVMSAFVGIVSDEEILDRLEKRAPRILRAVLRMSARGTFVPVITEKPGGYVPEYYTQSVEFDYKALDERLGFEEVSEI